MHVGTYSDDPSMYVTFDQGGNVWEWNDAVIDASRGLRGGSWYYNIDGGPDSSSRAFYGPSDEDRHIGIRVASVPEPSAMVLTMLASGVMLMRRKR